LPAISATLKRRSYVRKFRSPT